MMQHLALNKDIKEAIETPRLHHQLQPDKLHLEIGFPAVMRSRCRDLN